MGMDANDIHNLLKIKLSPAPKSHAGWTVDAVALGRACNMLTLKRQVLIRYTTVKKGTHAGKHFDRFESEHDEYYHRILLEQNRRLESANRTLWHELAHCVQSERLGVREFDKQYWDYHYSVGYHNNPFEVEARSYSEQYADKYPLIVEVTR
jgi:hypothetical protein